MHVLIVGAGIAGLTAAIALRHKGIDATIIEQATQHHRAVGGAVGDPRFFRYA